MARKKPRTRTYSDDELIHEVLLRLRDFSPAAGMPARDEFLTDDQVLIEVVMCRESRPWLQPRRYRPRR